MSYYINSLNTLVSESIHYISLLFTQILFYINMISWKWRTVVSELNPVKFHFTRTTTNQFTKVGLNQNLVDKMEWVSSEDFFVWPPRSVCLCQLAGSEGKTHLACFIYDKVLFSYECLFAWLSKINSNSYSPTHSPIRNYKTVRRTSIFQNFFYRKKMCLQKNVVFLH